MLSGEKGWLFEALNRAKPLSDSFPWHSSLFSKKDFPLGICGKMKIQDGGAPEWTKSPMRLRLRTRRRLSPNSCVFIKFIFIQLYEFIIEKFTNTQ
jgi:hypothetical protein